MKGQKTHQKHPAGYAQKSPWSILIVPNPINNADVERKKKNCQNNQNSYHWAWILNCRPSNLSFCLSSTVCSIKQWLCLSFLCRWAHHVISINNKMSSASKWTHSEGRRMMGAILGGRLHYGGGCTVHTHTPNPLQKQTHRKIMLRTEPEKTLPFIMSRWVQWLPCISTSRMSRPNSSASLKCTLSGDWALPLPSYQAQIQGFSGFHSMLLRCFSLVYRTCFLSSSRMFWGLQKPPPLAAVTQRKMNWLRAASLKHNAILMYWKERNVQERKVKAPEGLQKCGFPEAHHFPQK